MNDFEGGEPAAERALARSLAERLNRGKEPIRIALRELRDASPGHQRLTLLRRETLQKAFADEGLVTAPLLRDAALDETVEIRFAESRWRQRARTWIGRPATKGTRIAIAVIGVTAGLLSLSQLLPEDDDPVPMSGDVNVLVAGLGDPRSEAAGLGLAESLSRSLRTVMPALDRPGAPDVQIRGPRDAGVATTQQEAEELAAANGAQIVVYGEVARRRRDTVALPKVLVDPSWLIGAEELGGEYALEPIDLGRVGPGSSLAGRAAFRVAVAEQLTGLSALTIALGWFNAGSWERAERWFERARESWAPGERRAIAELFVGNAAGKQGHFAEADAAYRRAAVALPNPDRALLGMAQLSLNRALEACGEEADPEALANAVAQFAAIGARAQPDTLPGRGLALRSRLGEARGSLCLALAGEQGRHEAAVGGFREVLAIGAGEVGHFQAELAEARGGLGLALLAPGAPDHSRSAYIEARSQYLKARVLTNDPAREQVFTTMISLIDDHLEATDPNGTDGTLVDEEPPSSDTIWGRTDPVPAGARRQLGFYGIGDVLCSPRELAQPRLELTQLPFDNQAPFGPQPEPGDTLVVCFLGMGYSEPISLTIAGPEGFHRRSTVRPDPRIAPNPPNASFEVDLNWPLGRYTALATQGNDSAKIDFSVVSPRIQGVRAWRVADDRVQIMVAGGSPDAEVPVDVYRLVEPRPSTYLKLYATTFVVKTNGDGYGERWLPIDPADEGEFILLLRGSNPNDPSAAGELSLCDDPGCE